MESNGGIMYETLDAFPFFTNSDPETSESYAVFRNEITASTNLSADIPVANYFSLDADAAAETPRREVEESPSYLHTVDHANGGNNASELAWFRAGSRFKSPMMQLHKEIIDFSEFVSPTPEEQTSRAAAVQCVIEVVKYIWPHCKVEVFGSFRTGLYLPTSDIDAVILESNVKTPQVGLYALARALSQRNIAKKTQVLARARVPIIKFVERRSGIAFDISFDIDSGPKAADFIKDAVKKWPPLRPLCLILKVFLQQRELNEVYSGGIGSYTLLTMLIAHLQTHWRVQDLHRCRQSVEHNLGVLLVNFFDFYGRKLNTSDVGVSCNFPSAFYLKTDRGFLNSERPWLLSVEDPQEPDNDIGRNSFNYYKVKSAFSMAHSLLTDARNIMDLGSRRSILGTIFRQDPVLLNRRGGNDGELTFDRLLPGAGEPVPRQFENGSSAVYNWQLIDEEPLPREKIPADDGGLLSSGKRKGPKSKRRWRKCDGEEASKAEYGAKGIKRRKSFPEASRNRSRNH